MKILLVDDDPIVVKAMGTLMARAGLEPVLCKTAADALLRVHPGIAAAVVDIHLPDGDGLALSQALRQKLGPRTPIIILSGDNSMQTLRALPSAGATHFFSKPVDAPALIEQVKQWVSVAAENLKDTAS